MKGIKPHSYIQWKGTDICMDFRCSCGESSHFDGSFMYFIECPHCHKVFKCGQYIEHKEVTRKYAKSQGYIKEAIGEE